ncbi:hypothetical protein B0H14DRAFT_3887487 [Mycena olivaceomarginata]|nr:hypothetical protein B0H14DRAFT_3887487 [Mycena olivaceomarginata]
MASESPFAAQLGTNYCPKDNEVLEIQALLVEPTLRLKNLDNEIAELQKAIDKLVEERDGLEVYVDAHKALISPARRLPLDIIQEIFVACIPKHRNCVMSASEAPVLLGRICSSWRALSLTTPRLWASLHIVEPPRERYGSPNTVVDEKVAQRLDTMKMWLGRSGQCPLSISLQSGPNYESPPGTPTTSHSRSGEFLQELISFVGRWQHIHFRTPSSILERIAHLTPADVPMLESVAFYPQQNQFPPRGLDWENFGMLSGVAVSLGLLHLPVELPFLHTLELDFGTIPSNLLHRLSLLQLREFTLHGRIDAHHPIAPFFGVCTCLETLNIDSNSFTKTSLLESLRALPPTMRHLTVYDISPGSPLTTSLDDDVLAALTPAPEPSAVCCPSLETLSIDFSSLISDEALLRFVTGRMASPGGSEPTLKRVDIQFNRRMTSDIMPTLKPFVEEIGLDGLADAPSPWGPGFAA